MIQSNLFTVWKEKEAELGRRLTLKEVSAETGVAVPTLSRWLNRHPTRFASKTVAALTRYFGCDVDDLLVEVKEE